jgi:hypothetical protein
MAMRWRYYMMGLLLGMCVGCAHKKVQVAEPTPPAPFQQYIATNFDWSTVKRVVLMPLANQSAFEHASNELQANLAAELQRVGRFDVVVATDEDPAQRAKDVFHRGAFDELELLRIARNYDAQAVMFGMVTQYHPYAPPRVGLSLIMISPAEGVAIASADGLWDARELSTARQSQAYLQEMTSWRQGLLGLDRAIQSPDVYQRFVCQQIATSLNPPQIPGGNGFLPNLSSVPGEILPARYESAAVPSGRSNSSAKFNPNSR